MGTKKTLRLFDGFCKRAARTSGHAAAFVLACLAILAWAALGPLFGFGDTWQLTINTLTTVVTFLMVFLIQNTQTRDIEALQVKVDDLIRTVPGARTALLDLEELPEEELHRIQGEYEALAEKARRLRAGRKAKPSRR